jgi:hypothetical protein
MANGYNETEEFVEVRYQSYLLGLKLQSAFRKKETLSIHNPAGIKNLIFNTLEVLYKQGHYNGAIIKDYPEYPEHTKITEIYITYNKPLEKILTLLGKNKSVEFIHQLSKIYAEKEIEYLSLNGCKDEEFKNILMVYGLWKNYSAVIQPDTILKMMISICYHLKEVINKGHEDLASRRLEWVMRTVYWCLQRYEFSSVSYQAQYLTDPLYPLENSYKKVFQCV